MSIIASNITKLYGTQKALDNVSFEIKSGEIVGFLGPNGAGKSTMMKILTCFLPPTSGEGSVCGFNILEQTLEVRKKVGYLPENNPLYLDMYIREYLEFVAGLYKLGKNSKKHIQEMIELTGLNEEIKKKIGALSKGFRQRVGLAQALIHNPEVLILDEPTSGLDPNQIIEIRNLIKEIGKQKTIMLSTHIMQEVEAICDRVMIIDKGIIIADKITADIHKMSGKKQIISVEFNVEVDANLLNTIEGVAYVKNIKDNIWEITTETIKDIREDIFKFAVKNNIAVLSMKIEENTLEEVFHQLTMK
jgi:ABC-2 type transport system ATP-binding protein